MHDTNISYTLKRIRRTKHVKIQVDARSRVIVTAPMRCSQIFIKKFVYEQKDWIIKRQMTIETQKNNWIIPAHVSQNSITACGAQSKKFVRDRLKHYNEYYHYTYGAISVKDMKSRWGSCSSTGRMSFHYRLMFLPIKLADYIIVHELCHLKELNHSSKFWRLVAEQIPDYRRRREALKQYPI